MTLIRNEFDPGDTDIQSGVWVHGEELRWLDEDGNIRASPTDEDIDNIAQEYDSEDYGRAIFNNSGIVGSGNCANLVTVVIPPSSSLYLDKFTLLQNDGDPTPNGVRLITAVKTLTTDWSLHSTIIHPNENVTIDELVEDEQVYDNSTTESKIVMVGVDNGHFESGSNATQDIQVSARVWTQ